MKKLKGNVFIFGTGLIGSSIGLAIKSVHDAYITAHDTNESNSRLAKSLGIIDQISVNMEAELSEADLIILATPVIQAENILESLQHIRWKENAIMTDVGSVKQSIVNKVERTIKNQITFIGGHPMAGSHKTGPASAKAHLIENAFYVLTPFQDTSEEKINILMKWLKGTNAKFVTMTPEEHDKVTGVISHFPHIIAASLVRQVEQKNTESNYIGRMAAGGFKDITRIASSSPSMWRDITMRNKTVLMGLLDDWIEEMHVVKEMVGGGTNQEIYDYFSGAKNFRDTIPTKGKGAIQSFYDLYVDIPDQPGAISHITTILAIERINITNIRIIETRDDVLGALRISFQREEDRKKAAENLEQCRYETYIMTE